MPCNSCGTPFSIFKKEKGCPSCGFSYCSSCLNQKIFLPKYQKEMKCCQKCKNKEGEIGKKINIEPPKAFIERMGQMKTAKIEKELNEDVNLKNLKANLSPADQAIAERVQKLREERETLSTNNKASEKDIKERLDMLSGLDKAKGVSDNDIEARLARLRGESCNAATSTTSCINPLPKPDTRTEEEHARDLIKQYMDEVELDMNNKKAFDAAIDDIQMRLLALRGERKEGDSEQASGRASEAASDSENEEEMVRRIVEEFKAKSELESKIADSPEERSTSEELPWCEICNEDAQVRCRGCQYIFCKRCFNEHKDDDDGCNNYDVYKKK